MILISLSLMLLHSWNIAPAPVMVSKARLMMW